MEFPEPQARVAAAPSVGSQSVVAQNADEAFALTLTAVLEHGHDVAGVPDPDSRDTQPAGFREILGYQLALETPIDRIARSRGLNLVSAVARFVWMVAGNERFEDIYFYEPKVEGFTDDHVIVPGSNYGKRIRAPEPGLDQLRGVIERLRANGDTRRAALSIWHAQDAVRETRDLPCAFGMYFHARGHQLLATTMMRSNNAFTLLPFNLFEFGLLAEVVAAELDLELGTCLHLAGSMHVFDSQRSAAEKALAAYEAQDDRRPTMDPMPRQPKPLGQITTLAQLEAAMRHDASGISTSDLGSLLRVDADLHPYWQGFYRVLLVHALCRVKRFDDAAQLAHELFSPLDDSASLHVEKLRSAQPTPQPGQLHLVPEDPSSVARHAVEEEFALTDEDRQRATEMLEEICAGLDIPEPVSVAEYRLLRQRLVMEGSPAVAARAETGSDEELGDAIPLTEAEVRDELARIRGTRR